MQYQNLVTIRNVSRSGPNTDGLESAVEQYHLPGDYMHDPPLNRFMRKGNCAYLCVHDCMCTQRFMSGSKTDEFFGSRQVSEHR